MNEPVEPLIPKRKPDIFEREIVERFISLIEYYLWASATGLLPEIVEFANSQPDIPIEGAYTDGPAGLLKYVEASDNAIAGVEEWLKWVKRQRAIALDAVMATRTTEVES